MGQMHEATYPGRSAACNAALLTRDRHKRWSLWRSRVSSASLRVALRPGHESLTRAPAHEIRGRRRAPDVGRRPRLPDFRALRPVAMPGAWLEVAELLVL